MLRLTRVTPGRLADLRRGAAVVLLLAAAAIGLRSRAGLSLAGRSAEAAAGHAFPAVLGAIEGLSAVACVVLLILVFSGRRWKRKPEDNQQAGPGLELPWWWRVLGLLIALAVAFVPVVLLVLAGRGAGRGPGALLPGGLPSSHVSSAAGVTAGDRAWLLAGLAAVGVAVVVLGLSSLRRPRRPAPEADGTEPAAVGLAAAMSAGTAALHGHDDPRTAIIACYAAMEQNLSRAGSAPAAADTPAEVLDRAAASGLVRSAAAGALTRLFRKARYSDHVMVADDRAAALSALAELRADLSESGALGGPGQPGVPGSRGRPACRSGR
jgi:Domain of unknown function (DUF4129)